MSEALARVRSAASRLEAARDDLQQAVDDARGGGVSWAEVGRVLGTSRQAAFKRFGHPRDPVDGAPMTPRSTGPLVDLAEGLFHAVDRGDHDEVRRHLGDDATSVLTREAVLGTWSSAVAEVGNLAHCEGSRVELHDGSVLGPDERALGAVVVDTTLVCEAGELRGRVALDDHDRVVGWLVVPPDRRDLPF